MSKKLATFLLAILSLAPLAYADNAHINRMVMGDFDGDGRPDLAIISAYGEQNGPLYLNLSTAPIGSRLVRVAVAKNLAAGDFDGDGNLDLVYTRGGDPFMHILLGNGDGTFREADPIEFATGAIITVGDYNGDGLDDILAVFSQDNVYLFLSNGDGTFERSLRVFMRLEPKD